MAYFAFEDVTRSEFIFEVTDQARIDQARRIVSGEERDEVHVLGRIVKRQQPYNPQWSFHLDPNTISFFQMAIEVCDSTTPYVEDNLDEACGAFLPGCFWCPWSSKVTREVEPD